MVGGQDKPAWTACPPGVKITRVGGKITRDSLPPQGASCPGGQDKLLHRVAMAFNTSRQSIDRIRQRYAASGDVKDLPRSGRPRAKNRAEDQLITNTTLRNRFTNAPTTTRWIRQQRCAGGIPVSVQTIRNRLHAAGLKSRVPAKKPCLSQRHRAARLQFARNHVRWNRQQWRTVTFSDESRFCLRHIDGRLRVWHRNRERHAEVNVQPRHAYNGGSVMVWAGVTADRRTDLVVVPALHRQDLMSSCGAFPTPNGQQWHLPRWQRKAASGKKCWRISAS